MKRVTLLYGNAGGGHRSAAEAIAQGLRIVYGDEVESSLVDGLRRAPQLVKNLVETYPQMVNQARFIYALGYHAINDRRVLTALRSALEPVTELSVENMLLRNPADVYVSCHPLFNTAVPKAIQMIESKAKFVHVVTDLVSGHVMHYDPSADHIVVPTEESRRDAIANMVPIEKISVCGQPVWPDFRQRMGQRDKVRAEMGLNDRPVVLLMGGGDGMGRIEAVARELMHSDLPIQLVVICGRNEQLKDNIEFLNSRIPVRILGFVTNVPELMSAADILATKAGPSTICEGFIAGLPVILFDAVPGQEEGNVDYVVSSGAGAWCPNPAQVKKQVQHWLQHPADFRITKLLASTLARPDSAIEIAKVIGRFL